MAKATKNAISEQAAKKLTPTQQAFAALGLVSDMDFVLHLPMRYEDETRIHSINEVWGGQGVQLEGTIIRADVVAGPRRFFTAVLQDSSGQINLRWIHFYPSLAQQITVGKFLRVKGEIRAGFHGLEIIHPKVSQAGAPLAQTLTPIYPATEKLRQSSIQKAINLSLSRLRLEDSLPDEILQKYHLGNLEESIRFLHHPSIDADYESLLDHSHPAWERIKFDESLAQQMALTVARNNRSAQNAMPLEGRVNGIYDKLLAKIPFALTQAQQKVLNEIFIDLNRNFPMHRLLQGDVGSGKTVVAALAAARALDSQVQVAIMAPTEILAEQHLKKLSQWFEGLGINIVWLTGQLTPKQKRLAYEDIASGQAHLVIGTQAIIQQNVEFKRLGLMIVDEQHRFGVGQRLTLSKKGEEFIDDVLLYPHQLTMSATPIPRTLAMTFYADLDVSVIDELPPGRKPIITKVLSDKRKPELIAGLGNELAEGKQIYWVCPLVEESEVLQLQAAIDTHAQLQEAFTQHKIGLIHGKLPAQEKAQVMAAFAAHEIDLLVATTVIEVGVDVPNASLMIIEHAERFGLAQLHQLRGRVGRGEKESVCVLLYQAPLSKTASYRLKAMYETNDGFEIARRDLKLRGPGEFLGLKQSGVGLFRFVDIDSDIDIVEQSKACAIELLDHYPKHAQQHLNRWMKNKHEYLRS